jgi:hypothetical protein
MSDRRVVGFRQDAEHEWVARLECGHEQHVRHDPPWQVFPWILHHQGRAEHIGTELFCRRCEDERKRTGERANP